MSEGKIFKVCPEHRYILVEDFDVEQTGEEDEVDSGFLDLEVVKPAFSEIDHDECKLMRVIQTGSKVTTVLDKGGIVLVGDTHLTKKITLPNKQKVQIITENQIIASLFYGEETE